MKWHWQLSTVTGRDSEQEIQGNVFGSFTDVIAQVERAVVFHGWGKNTADCTITIKTVTA